MRIRYSWRTGALLAVLALSACANYTPRIRADDIPTANDVYLYGRFYIEAPKATLALDGHQTMGFAITCADQQTYTIRFSVDDPLQVIKIAPSTCTLTDIVYSDADGSLKSRKPAPAGLMRNVRFDAGKAYYLGDFYAATTTTVSGRMIYRNWQMKSVKDDYDITTTKLKAAFPNLSAVQTEDRMIGAK